MSGREPGARKHEAGLVLGDLDRDPGADRGAFARPEHGFLERVQIEPGITAVGPRRQ